MDDLVDYSISDRVAGMPLRLQWVGPGLLEKSIIRKTFRSRSGQLRAFHYGKRMSAFLGSCLRWYAREVGHQRGRVEDWRGNPLGGLCMATW
jgi:hypothetical protein